MKFLPMELKYFFKYKMYYISEKFIIKKEIQKGQTGKISKLRDKQKRPQGKHQDTVIF